MTPAARVRSGFFKLEAATLALGIIAWTHAAAAETFHVTDESDSGSGTLRRAINDANDSPGSDRIVFDFEVPTTITVETALPEITEELLIKGGMVPTILRPESSGATTLRVADDTTTVRNLVLDNNQIKVQEDGTFSLSLSDDARHILKITGEGAFEKKGGGELTLSDSSDYTGGTVVRSGALRGDTDSLQGKINLRKDTLVIFDSADSGTYDGKLKGKGGLEKDGGGKLTLGGENQHKGGTRIRGGTLSTPAENLSGDVRIDDGARFELDQADDGKFGGNIKGDGELRKRGGGQLTLKGKNTYKGGTTVSEGVLVGDVDSISGNVDVDSGATLRFDQPDDGTHSGDIRGNGEVVKDGAGTLTLTGNNRYTGGTTVEAGTLEGDTQSLQGEIKVEAGAEVAFVLSGDGTFSGNVNGDGSLRKGGNGALTIDRAQDYMGGTTVSNGQLLLMAAIEGDVDVHSGATLGGTAGAAGALKVRGSVAPTGFATLSFGSVKFEKGSSLSIEMDDTGDAGSLVATGLAEINGAQVVLDPRPGDYSAGVTATVLTGMGGLSGAFDEVVPSFAFLAASLDVAGDAVNVTLQAKQTDIDDFATTSNQTAVANALEEMLQDGDSDVDTVRENLSVVTTDEVPALLDGFAGDELAGFLTARLADAGRYSRSQSALFDATRLRAAGVPSAFTAATSATKRSTSALLAPRTSASPVLAVATPSVGSAAPVASDERWSAWIDMAGLFGRLEGDHEKDVNYDIYGPTVGLDYELVDGFTLGGSVGYARTALKTPTGPTHGDADTFHVGVYSVFASSRFYVGGGARFGYSEMDSDRWIAFEDISRRASADFDSWDVLTNAEAAYAFGQPDRLEISPTATLLYAHIDQDGFSEHGAGSLGLAVSGQEVDSLVSRIGLRLRANYEISERFRLIPVLQAAWEHEYLDPDIEVRARFEGANSGGRFKVDGARAERDTAVMGVGWETSLTSLANLYLLYDARLNADLLEHFVSFGLRAEW